MARQPAIIDLFGGVGGLSLGAARAGFQVLGAVDNDKRAIAAHAINFPNAKHLNADITEASAQRLLDGLGICAQEVDGVVGGPPCQGFSVLGMKDASDERNNLFVEFFRIVAEIKPAFFLAENVPGIMRPKYAAVRNAAKDLVSPSYKILDPIAVCASEYGAPTSRTRMFFIGYMPDRIAEITPEAFAPRQITKLRMSQTR